MVKRLVFDVGTAVSLVLLSVRCPSLTGGDFVHGPAADGVLVCLFYRQVHHLQTRNERRGGETMRRLGGIVVEFDVVWKLSLLRGFHWLSSQSGVETRSAVAVFRRYET